MTRVLITDDEIQIRKGLRMKVDWGALGYEIVAEAANGMEAMDVLTNQPIDLLITDVKMPIMDGLQLVKECKKSFPHVKVVVLSGYSEFEYARSALREGVIDYLLKPIAPNELLHVLEKVKAEIEKDRFIKIENRKILQVVDQHLADEQERFILRLVKDRLIETAQFKETVHKLKLEHLFREDLSYQFISVEIRDSQKNPNKCKDLWDPFFLLCREIARKRKNRYVFYDPNYINMMTFIEGIHHAEVQEQTLPKEISHYVNTYMNLEVVIGVGKVVNDYTSWKDGYRSSLLSWSHSEIGKHSQILHANMEKEMFKFSSEIERKIINSIENNKLDLFMDHIYSLLGEKQNHSIMSFSFVANRLLFLLDGMADKYQANLEEIKQIMWKCQQYIWQLNVQEKVVEGLIQLGKMIIEKVHKQKSSVGVTVVENVRHYLEAHFGDEISLTNLSNQFHMNSAYLSELFKVHVGQNLSDFLLQLRMEKAIQLLEDNELKITDVAQLVGFSNSGYFSTVFKKYYGRTPADFRKCAMER